MAGNLPRRRRLILAMMNAMTDFDRHSRMAPALAADNDPRLPHLQALREGRHPDPFAFLGAFDNAEGRLVRAFLPGARRVGILDPSGGPPLPMTEIVPDLFEAILPRGTQYRLTIEWAGGIQETSDPYAFGPLLPAEALYAFRAGTYPFPGDLMGAHATLIGGEQGIRFAVWAPNARAASVVGDFNGWNAARHPMRLRHEGGVWELFIPGLSPGATYKFALVGADGEKLPWKADPFARAAELPPRTGSIIAPPLDHEWNDGSWMESRAARQAPSAPISIYEVHVGAWLNGDGTRAASWDEATERLVPHVKALGFTHIELMPVAEYPFGGSWGYQPLSLFAPTSRLGDQAGLARFVDRCHQLGIGVLLDWVAAHFPSDDHGLARFDGTHLFEHADPREGFHQDWNSLIYNYGRDEVRGFLIGSALHWLRHFHIDGLRVDAVASMLYRDYSRKPGEWIPNHLGGRENFEAIDFMRRLNDAVREHAPGAVTMAEESTAWPGVTRPVAADGLGFDYKWNMGWMHDSLRYFSREPAERLHHARDITFGLEYAFSEKYVLPLSHDEVVHGKKSLLGRMPGDDWQRFANLRLCFAWMWMHPGKKLLFMGGEFGAAEEWNVDAPLPWPAEDDPFRHGLTRLIGDLNALYRRLPALHKLDAERNGFEWLAPDEHARAIFACLRQSDAGAPLVVIANMLPEPRNDFTLAVPRAGGWREILNTDSWIYGGSDVGNNGWIEAAATARGGEMRLTLPPLGLLLLEPAEETAS